MPFVFLGSFYGVLIGKEIGSIAQMAIYSITVAWSIYTSLQKALQLRRKENQIFAPNNVLRLDKVPENNGMTIIN